MYRLLEVGEVIEKGDEWYNEQKGWYKSNSVGDKLWISTPIRRLVKPAVTPAASSVPDPGEGWRLLEVGETELAGDQYWDDCDKRWLNAHFGGSVYDEHDRKGQYFLRRRVSQPAPVVSVGDRVKVLSGPWAGCTGVVTGFEAEVSLSGYGRMTARKDSVPVIEMDYVRVGGQRLSVKESKVEKLPPLPPVVPEVLYRDLSHGETIRHGDEIFTAFWTGAIDSIGTKAGSPPFSRKARRPVRLQSPGWRYLDAGETVQAGDEHKFFGPWETCGISIGKPVQDYAFTSFRRKLPANVGG